MLSGEKIRERGETASNCVESVKSRVTGGFILLSGYGNNLIENKSASKVLKKHPASKEAVGISSDGQQFLKSMPLLAARLHIPAPDQQS